MTKCKGEKHECIQTCPSNTAVHCNVCMKLGVHCSLSTLFLNEQMFQVLIHRNWVNIKFSYYIVVFYIIFINIINRQ